MCVTILATIVQVATIYAKQKLKKVQRSKVQQKQA